MEISEITDLIQKELPNIISNDLRMRDFIIRTVSEFYAGKQETESKFDRIMNELQRDREEQSRKWDENNRKWDENNRKWDEFIKEMREENKRTHLRFDKLERTLGAIGSRWGKKSEESFRNALKVILEDSFGVNVLNINDYDENGVVFGTPDQVEIDILINNGITIACELKSSISKSDVFVFEKKIAFYQKKYPRTVNRKIIISPMVDPRAYPLAEKLAIEIYADPEDVKSGAVE